MSSENREAQIPDFFKKSGILLFTNDLGLLYIDYIGSDRLKSVINILSDQALFLKPHIHQSKCQTKSDRSFKIKSDR
ncbi:hypothetical protein LC613_05540 [Nostoc sphaeroides CHAB 2801]|uniref:hypothetical protein n=1 Tax=Nostoc sphaeroides TaxID=446679 RepID=UPI000E4B1741|nr:hypothetical protein [Nostoc sphaeroides]MCC5627637.1 hypothetical protein [Nostoc sphaeroides CHAB 2801]